MSPDRARAVRQLVVSFAITNGLVFALTRPRASAAGLHDLIGALFLLAALVSVRRDDHDTGRYGVRLAGIFPGRDGDERSLPRAVVEAVPSAARELAVAALVAAVVLPVYAYCWPWLNTAPAHRSLALDGAKLRALATELFAVALTEELYFRGYLLTRIADALGVPREHAARTSLRAMAAPVVLSAALFAVTHVTVAVTPQRAAVFFPGLLFGALRVRRGGVGAAVWMHAASNAFEHYLEDRW